jgi:heptaprenyl diphosphate synthase
MARAGVLTGFGLVLFLFETLIPRPLPWIKPGLANIATIVALYTLGSTAAWIVSILRCLLGSLIGGTLMNPAFWLSIAGAVASVAAMIVVRRFARRIFSIIGAGMIGAFAHTLAQATVADLMIAGKMRVVVLLPSMLLSALLTGLIVGYASHLIVARIARPMAFQPFAHKSRRDSDTVV